MAARRRATASDRYQMLLDDISARVVDLRGRLELTQEEASERAELDLRTWQRIEGRELTQPSLFTLVRVAAALEVEPWELLRPPGTRR